ncbi:rodlin [Streptomyces sp. MST-110588]|uniref:rodlin n=1 Tax=Streptomyces sp. MST-110588 TaxID=2833628 RepID=UPI001F5E0741|nr:rodlin [Streptomyces sp. MST-110588]UNO41632.1 RdlA protein [Streptomyces sp. MST-110588]
MKKMMAGALVTVSLVGMSAMAAPTAMAHDNSHDGVAKDLGPQTANGNGSREAHSNQNTEGKMSPQGNIIGESLNELCIGFPDDININSIVSLIPIAVQDIEILETEQHQTCTENSTQAKEDDMVSHIIHDIPIIGENGARNN